MNLKMNLSVKLYIVNSIFLCHFLRTSRTFKLSFWVSSRHFIQTLLWYYMPAFQNHWIVISFFGNRTYKNIVENKILSKIYFARHFFYRIRSVKLSLSDIFPMNQSFLGKNKTWKTIASSYKSQIQRTLLAYIVNLTIQVSYLWFQFIP